MSTDPTKVYWDADVLLSYINGDSSRLQHIEPMMAKSGEDFQLVTSALSITEVAFAKIEQDNAVLDSEQEKKILKLWQAGSPIRIVEFYELIAFKAQRLIRAAVEKKWSLKPADAIHLATADQLQVAKFNTYDDRLCKFKELTETKFDIVTPTYAAPMLPLVDEIPKEENSENEKSNKSDATKDENNETKNKTVPEPSDVRGSGDSSSTH